MRGFFLYAYTNYGSRERFFFKVHEGPSKAVADALSLTILENLNINFKKSLFLIDIFSSALNEFCCCSLIYMEEALWRNSESRTRWSSTPGPCPWIIRHWSYYWRFNSLLHICVQQYDSDPSSYYSVNGTLTFSYKSHQAILAKLTSEQGQVGP